MKNAMNGKISRHLLSINYHFQRSSCAFLAHSPFVDTRAGRTRVDNDGAYAYVATASWIARQVLAFGDTYSPLPPFTSCRSSKLSLPPPMVLRSARARPILSGR